MKILCICSEGNSRSVQFAHLLKYWGNDCISIGMKNTSQETIDMLIDWADKVIIFEQKIEKLELLHKDKTIEFFLPDEFPRPFNKELHEIAKRFLEENKNIFKNN